MNEKLKHKVEVMRANQEVLGIPNKFMALVNEAVGKKG